MIVIIVGYDNNNDLTMILICVLLMLVEVLMLI